MEAEDQPGLNRMVTAPLRFKHHFTKENPGKIDDYIKLDRRTIGEGSYGKVVKGVDKNTGAERAVKAIDISKLSDHARFEREIAIQTALDHPNIVKLYETFKDAKRIYLVMELCSGGELFDRIIEQVEKHGDGHAFGESAGSEYMKQIMGAVWYLHKNEFVHRDIKPENFLMQNRQQDAPIKIIDFGLAKHFAPGDTPMRTKAGTPYYVAPQVLNGSYDEKCDIWSCGVIAYILLCGYPPFFGDTDNDILNMVKKGKFDFPAEDWGEISGEAKDFIKIMLTKEPEKRPAAKDLLEHPWLRLPAQSRSPKPIAPRISDRLKAFRGMAKLKKVALTYIAQQLKDEDIQDLRETFVALDKNKDGTLTAAEIKDGMRERGLDIPENLEAIVKSIDTDGSNAIDYTEFIAATLSYQKYWKEELMWSAFRTFDIDGDGFITREELAQVVEISDDPTSSSILGMIKEVDKDGDGTVSFEEFKAMMTTREGSHEYLSPRS